MYRQGVSVAIVGKANVGKSSLFNRLLDRDRAIVTSVPGSTSDLIEESVNMSGVPVRLIDMAGLRPPRGQIEVHGITRAREQVAAADLILLVLDRSRPLDDDDRDIMTLLSRDGVRMLTVVNKCDLPEELFVAGAADLLATARCVEVSALTGEGTDDVKRAIVELILAESRRAGTSEIVPLNLRHKRSLAETGEIVAGARAIVEGNLPWDLVAIEVRRALHVLGEIVGETTTEEVLDAIFSRFCVGK
jgi:tRNA modification GTPase